MFLMFFNDDEDSRISTAKILEWIMRFFIDFNEKNLKKRDFGLFIWDVMGIHQLLSIKVGFKNLFVKLFIWIKFKQFIIQFVTINCHIKLQFVATSFLKVSSECSTKYFNLHKSSIVVF